MASRYLMNFNDGLETSRKQLLICTSQSFKLIIIYLLAYKKEKLGCVFLFLLLNHHKTLNAISLKALISSSQTFTTIRYDFKSSLT